MQPAFCPAALALVQRYCAGAKNLRLSVGIERDGRQSYLCYSAEEGLRFEQAPWVYEIGSITKTFTSSLLCRQLERDRLALHHTVRDYYGGLPDGWYYPTLEQLATHTAGYGERLPYTDAQSRRHAATLDADPLRVNPFEHLTEEDLCLFVQNAKLHKGPHPPVYSNLGTAVLGDILGKTEGGPIAPLLMEYIAGELGLSGFTVGPPAAGAVNGYNAEDENCGNWLWGQGPFACIGGLYAAAAPLLAYARLHLRATPAYLALGHSPRAACFEPGAQTGLLWLYWPRQQVLWHNGGTGCFKTFLGLSRPRNSAAVVLANQKARAGVTPEAIGMALLGGL